MPGGRYKNQGSGGVTPILVPVHVHGHKQVRVHVYTLNTEKVPT